MTIQWSLFQGRGIGRILLKFSCTESNQSANRFQIAWNLNKNKNVIHRSTQFFLASKLPLKNRCKASSSLSVSGTWKWPSSVHWRCWLAFQCCRWLLGIAWISAKPHKTHEKTGEVKPMLEVKRKLYVDKRNHRYRSITSWHHLCSAVCEVHNVYHAYPAVLLAGERNYLDWWVPFILQIRQYSSYILLVDEILHHLECINPCK